MLGIAYAGVQFVTFSKIFASISRKLLSVLVGLGRGCIDKVFTLLYLKKLLNFARRLLKGD